MGAALYIQPIHEKNRQALDPKFQEAVKLRDSLPDGPEKDKAQAQVNEIYDLMYSPESYFRDNYNCFSVLNAIGLSWWQDCPTTKRGLLPPARARKFLAMVEAHDLPESIPFDAERWKSAYWEDKPVTPAIFQSEIRAWWAQRRRDLINFLKRAIESGLTIDASL